MGSHPRTAKPPGSNPEANSFKSGSEHVPAGFEDSTRFDGWQVFALLVLSGECGLMVLGFSFPLKDTTSWMI